MTISDRLTEMYVRSARIINNCIYFPTEHGSDDEEFTSDSSSHVSDDSYGEAFVDDEMDSKSVTVSSSTAAHDGCES